MGSTFSRYQPAAQEFSEQGYPSETRDPDYAKFWWDMQFKRCIMGYEPTKGDWIPGTMYFHVNFVQGQLFDEATQRKSIGQYPYDDLSHELFCFYDQCKKDHIGAFVMKGRRLFFTTTTSTELLHEWTFWPGSVCGVGAWKDDHVKTVRANINIIRSLLPAPLMYKSMTNNDDVLIAGRKESTLGGAGETNEGTFSTLHYRCFGPQKTNIGAFRSLTLSKHLIDEIGENPFLFKSVDASRECWSEGQKMYGLPILGGTANKVLNESPDLDRLVGDPEKFGFRMMVIPRQRHYYPFVDLETGIVSEDNQKKAEIAIKAHADSLYEEEDKTEYYTFCQENPTCLSDMLMGNAGNSQLPMDQINHQIKILNDYESIKNAMRYCNIEWKNGRYDSSNPQVEFDYTVNKQEAEYRILHGPNLRYKHLDIGGCDTYFKSGAPNSTSKGVMYVFRNENEFDSSMFGNGPVAEYAARYPTTTQFYKGCHKLAVAYGCMLLSEHDDAFRVYLESVNALNIFKLRPTALDTELTTQSQAYMVTMSPAVKKRGTTELWNYFSQYSQNVAFDRLLGECKNFGSMNTDFVMAFMITLIHKLDARKILIEDTTLKKEIKKMMPSYKRDPRTGIITPIGFEMKKERFDITKRA